MKRRRILLLLALVAVVAGVLLFWPRGPKEPVYQGKGITFWIYDAPDWGTEEGSEAARRAIQATAADSRRFLMSELARRDPKWLVALRVWFDDTLGVDAYEQSEARRLETIRAGLIFLGPEITPALPVLAEYLGDYERGYIAASVMSGAGDAATPYLVRAIASTNPVVVQTAGFGIAALARDTDSILPTLLQWLDHTNGGIRSIAVRALGESHSETKWIVPALVDALSDPDLGGQLDAAEGLRLKGPPAAWPAVPALLRMMTNSSLDVAMTASNAVFYIDPTALPELEP